MCNCAVNWCDKLCFLHLYLLFYCQFCHMTRWGSKQSHSHRAYIVIFSFLFMWPLKLNHELIPILTFRVTQCHDLDRSGSREWRDVIVHVTIYFPVVISYRCAIGTKSVSLTVVEVMGPKYIGVMTSTFLGYVTSSFSWPFKSQWVISYWWSIGPKSLSPVSYTHLTLPTIYSV